jgi:sugar phosphate permease
MRNLRWFIVCVWFVLAMVSYIDRMNLAIAAVPIMKQFQISATTFGYVVSAFTIGYCLFSVPVGVILDKYGIKKPTIIFTIGWAFFSILSGAAWALFPLLVFRFIFGMSETVLAPGFIGLNNNWMLPKERGRTSGLFLASVMVGTVLGGPINALAVSIWDWRAAFYVTGILSLFVTLLIYFFIKDRPREHRRITKEELELIEQEHEKEAQGIGKSTVKPTIQVGLSAVFKNKTIWVTGIALFLINFLYWANLQWLPTYFRLVRHTTIMGSGFYTALPFIAAALGNYISGELTDRVFKKMRIPIIVIGAIMAAPFAVWAMVSPSVVGSVAGFMLMAFFNGWAISQSYTLPMEIFPNLKHRAPTISAFYIACNSMAGIIAPLIVGPILDSTGSFSSAFYIFAAANVVGGLIFLSVYKTEKKLKKLSLLDIQNSISQQT